MRSTNAVARRRAKKRLSKRTKGYRGGRSKLLRSQKETLLRSGAYAFRDRRVRKRQFRRLWIVRINAAARELGLRYSELVHGLKLSGIELNRKMLAEIAVGDPHAFETIVTLARRALESPEQSFQNENAFAASNILVLGTVDDGCETSEIVIGRPLVVGKSFSIALTCRTVSGNAPFSHAILAWDSHDDVAIEPPAKRVSIANGSATFHFYSRSLGRKSVRLKLFSATDFSVLHTYTIEHIVQSRVDRRGLASK